MCAWTIHSVAVATQSLAAPGFVCLPRAQLLALQAHMQVSYPWRGDFDFDPRIAVEPPAGFFSLPAGLESDQFWNPSTAVDAGSSLAPSAGASMHMDRLLAVEPAPRTCGEDLSIGRALLPTVDPKQYVNDERLFAHRRSSCRSRPRRVSSDYSISFWFPEPLETCLASSSRPAQPVTGPSFSSSVHSASICAPIPPRGFFSLQPSSSNFPDYDCRRPPPWRTASVPVG